jgi:hypothetical protein
MPHALKISCALACSMLLASCATMSPEECQRANWHAVGLRDGQQGAAPDLLGRRAEDCAKVDVAIDTQAYEQGREQGLRSYCRLENAVPLGLSGAPYAGVCAPAIEGLFVPRYQAGRAVYLLRSGLQNLDERTQRLERRLHELRRDEDQRLRSASSDAERNQLRREMDAERRRIRDDLRDADRRLQRQREELRAAEFDLTQLR